jgi:hypothetical protein
MRYRSLDPLEIVDTAGNLARRIGVSFPGSGLSEVAGEVLQVGQEAAGLTRWLGRPQFGPRALAGIAIAALVAGLAMALIGAQVSLSVRGITELLQAIESGINDVVFIAVAVYFLWTLEARIKRRRALAAIHELRALAHIIDMHQLAKDPERLSDAQRPEAPGSPVRALTPFELVRYLDYCTELLALLSKVAALYVQEFADPVTLGAVQEIEDLSSGLSRKIWQKIMILDRIVHADPPASRPL